MNEQDKACLKAEEIVKSASLNRDEMMDAMHILIRDIYAGGAESEPPPKKKHWPGMYKPPANKGGYHSIWMPGATSESAKVAPSILDVIRSRGQSCASKEELVFVMGRQEGRLEIIDRLQELNDGWRPNWENTDMKYAPIINEVDNHFEVIDHNFRHAVPDWFQAKSKEIWEQTKQEFGFEKVKLALCPRFEESTE